MTIIVAKRGLVKRSVAKRIEALLDELVKHHKDQ